MMGPLDFLKTVARICEPCPRLTPAGKFLAAVAQTLLGQQEELMSLNVNSGEMDPYSEMGRFTGTGRRGSFGITLTQLYLPVMHS